MGLSRVFVPQETLDQWLTDGRVEIDGELMTLKPEGKRFRLKPAVHFLAEVGGGGDASGLVGRVKDHDQLAGLGGEHYADSVIIDENAYQVAEGFVGEPVVQPPILEIATGETLAAATRAAVGEESASDELELLSRFFLS
jgi:hypothetical protein